MAKGRFGAVVVTLAGAAIVAALFRFNPTAVSYNQYLVVNLMGLFWVPMLVILFALRQEPSEFGFTLVGAKRLWLGLGLLFAGLLVILTIASRWTGYQDYYPLFKRYPEFFQAFRNYPAQNPWTVAPWLMLYAEASYGMYMFCWEFFFRGFLLFGLNKWLGWGAVVVQAAAFTLLHSGKLSSEIAASFGAGVVLGIIALRSKSFLPCFVIHWAASVSFDFLIIAARPH